MKKKNKRNVTICVSWPYANNNLHLGYIASSLSGDILARYHRMAGDDVVMVSGTDSHGTKPTIKAKAEGVTPKDIVDRYHKNFKEALEAFSFSFDKFSITYDDYHKQKCEEIFKKLYDNGYLYEKILKRPYCPNCGKFVADTEIEITCPNCGKRTKADNCDCGHVPTEADLEGATCLICGETTVQRDDKVLVFKLTAFKDVLTKLVKDNENVWRANSLNETKKYLKDLRDRDFSRDLDWGVKIPIKGYENKVVWVWWEALLGYVTDTMKLGKERGFDYGKFWKTNVEPEKEKLIYMCHAKDNIVFHSMFLPAMLAGLKENYVINNTMVSSEYLTMNDAKISKSSGTCFEALVWAQNYNTDSLRYHFAANGPEKKDANFTLELYQTTHNNEVVNKFGNLINRTLKFKGLDALPVGKIDELVKQRVELTYDEVAQNIEKLEFKKAAETVMELVAFANRYYDEQKPWVQAKEDVANFNNTIYTCGYVIANLSNLFEPFMPKSCAKIREFLNLSEEPKWEEIKEVKSVKLDKVQPLFTRI